jgi:hypothetical protein
MEMGLSKLLFLLYSSVGKITYKEFIEEIYKVEMEEISNFPKTIFDSNIPKYDESKLFRYIRKDKKVIYLEVLGINKDILQSKIMIVFKTPLLWILSETIRYYETIVKLLTGVYGEGYPMEINGLKTFNFQNDRQVLYILKDRQNKQDIITINIGNQCCPVKRLKKVRKLPESVRMG